MPEILDLLGRHGARATFFVVGERVPGREDVLRRAVAERHELGNHTDTHPRASLLNDEQIADELRRANDRIRAAAGVTPRLMRPPYGDDAGRVAAVAARLGFAATLLWSIDTRDWTAPPPEEIARLVLAETKPGSVVLLHDSSASCPGSLEALARILPTLDEKGFEAVTVSELLSAGTPVATAQLVPVPE